jgi:hypothetical protein
MNTLLVWYSRAHIDTNIHIPCNWRTHESGNNLQEVQMKMEEYYLREGVHRVEIVMWVLG